MKEILLLRLEKNIVDYYENRTEYVYYEMDYSDSYGEDDIINVLSKHFEDVSINFLYNDGSYIIIDGKEEYFEIIPALKIGAKYFELKELPDYKN